jgi:hypothetical protein
LTQVVCFFFDRGGLDLLLYRLTGCGGVCQRVAAVAVENGDAVEAHVQYIPPCGRDD